MKFKEKYIPLKEKYSLPEYDELNLMFNIEEISDETDMVLQNIRRRMFEKLDYYTVLLESMLMPESSLSSLYEARYISDAEKNSAYAIFKRLIGLLRFSKLTALNNSEEENARYIRAAYDEWHNVKDEVKHHLERVLKLWEKETDIKDDLTYFG
jgi:hypothetical protein